MPPIVPDYTNEIPSLQTEPRKTKRGLILLISLGMALLALLVISMYLRTLTQPPANFPIGTSIEIEPGTSISAITQQLEDQNIIKSGLLLYIVLLTNYEPENVKASTYYFDAPLSVFAVADTLVTGDFNSNLLSFTHIEGERASHVAENAAGVLTDFDAEEFMKLASTSEGKLFPETYRIPKDFTEEELFTLMLETYEKNIAPLREQFKLVDLTENEVVILASIIEREANSVESMKMVSGILQNRIRIGMGLQVDASMEYVLDKPLRELTAEDLKMDSPYNTYLYRGLTPTAIGNPGLDAITAVLEPTPSEYMFYITGDDGNFYYAETFDEHKVNIARHLR
ncbi:endolytic transglycosylase MltG [Patescibacteria group bacterium]|nr:endolytic transglycosylase MltG [Patescibacteria group bacterium]